MNGQSTNALVGPLDSDVAIKSRIFTIRGVQVMLDRDLAALYGVSTKALNQAVKRNIRRFPDDFMFQLGKEDVENLRSQFMTSSWGGLRYMPYALFKAMDGGEFPPQKVFFDGRHYCAVSKMDAAFIPSILQRM
ncbi:MAG: ORF6N domain-containing protein [Kiritimatiellae bacterium]|nr:ORF6N domain-containing protein [Kiritimatiellia bacterium]